MSLLRNVVFIAALAGLFAGFVMAAMQTWATVPLILQAETYEAAAAPDHAHDQNAPAHRHDSEAWAPADGAERFAYTVLANVVTGIGFALILVAASELAGGIGGWRQGILWGFAGFAVFTLAPGLGLPPELPAMPAADLATRQAWWTVTVVATAGGLALIAFGRSAVLAIVGIALLIAPHLWGAPMPESFDTPVPGALHHRFVVAATVTSLVFWLALALAVSVIRNRVLGARHTSPSARLA